MRARCLPLLALALLAGLSGDAWGQARPGELPPQAPAPSAPARPVAQAPGQFPPPALGRPPGAAPRRASAAAPPATPSAPQERWVAIYAALAPASAFGINPAPADRLIAHNQAEALCRALPSSESCRQVLELREGCGVLVHAVLDLRPIRLTSPSPESLARQPLALSLAVQGPDLASAERDAMARCRERERRLLCWVATSACVAPR
jgi:hypothetical protein